MNNKVTIFRSELLNYSLKRFVPKRHCGVMHAGPDMFLTTSIIKFNRTYFIVLN